MKKNNLKEWKKIGNKTKDIRDGLNELTILLGREFGKNNTLCKKLKGINNNFDKLRSSLDEIVCGCDEFKKLPNKDITRIFYGQD